MFAPSPESQAVHFPPHDNSTTGITRVGMVVSNHDQNDDDDVSVLTFHTLGTKDTNSFSSPVGIRSDDVKNKLCISGEVMEIKKSLSHISEESKFGDDHNKGIIDDESLSVAESVLDSTNKLLNTIGSSSYYSELGTKLSNHEKKNAKVAFSPPPKPNRKHPSPIKLGMTRSTRLDATGFSPEKTILREKEEGEMNKTESTLAHHSRSNYVVEPNENENQSNNTSINSFQTKSSEMGTDKLHKMELETKQLQLLLREKQRETKLAMSELDASIQRANALLKQ